MFSMILAMDKNRLIGKGDSLPWDLPEDLQHFKTVTSRRMIVMGRKTFESIGRPLPNRKNVVITRDKNFKHEGVTVYHSIEEFKNDLTEEDIKSNIMIIGGANLIKQMYDDISTLYITHIYEEFEGDCYIDFIDFEDLNIIECKNHYKKDGFKYDFSYYTYLKKQK